MTRSVWFGSDKALIHGVLEGISQHTLHTQHPFFLARQILHLMTNNLQEEAENVLNNFAKIRGDIENAMDNNYVDGFEFYFYRANKQYFRVRTDIWASFHQAETLGTFILNGLSKLRENYPGPLRNVKSQDLYFEDVVSSDMERLSCFKKSIELRHEAVKHRLDLVSTLIKLLYSQCFMKC
jgi:hypothetical protein